MNRQRGNSSTYGTVAALALTCSACTLTPPNDNAVSTRATTTSGVPAGYYRVNPGDTLERIATDYGRLAKDLASWNQLPANAQVLPGQFLRVAPLPGHTNVTPQASTHTNAAPDDAANAGPSTLGPALAWPARGTILQHFVPGTFDNIVIDGTPGEPVKAAAAGRVVYAGTGISAYGTLVIIKHDDRTVTAYGHNRNLLVKDNDAVSQGQTIAEIGIGHKGIPGVLFEVRSDGKPVDPLPLLVR
ncbi:hypothetical protein WK68_20250 [Burkholderia ubonensis]|uniref:peptidoglycan DD-metalloendopeptidase family protein n=1 Tax=Burkholderia ubonensis TaxID=101571 RepID=UPI000758C1F1|nr:peptidoglycan DD-metalloendopeptidase family protein [Burkholderia ubonensis]KVU59651.1 hypothetical protein WK68_20250 [Burkholderia ubonensis]